MKSGMKMEIQFCNRNDKTYQKKLNALLSAVFFDFRFWYDLDLWDENYESYSIWLADEIVSNICVFKVKGVRNGAAFDALSLGAIATKADCRGRGYARAILEHILAKHPDMPMFLSANESVLGFYPRFGFTRVYEKLPTAVYTIHNDCTAHKLPHTALRVRDAVYQRCNIFTRLDCLNTQSVNMFHLYAGEWADCIYDVPACDSVVVARQSGETLYTAAVFAQKETTFAALAKALPFLGVTKVEFGFMPFWKDLDYTMEPYDGDPIFVRSVQCELGDFKLPDFSYT